MKERLELNPPGAVLEIASTLKKAGYEAWCVGGAVRDAILGIHQLDWDLATSATPKQVQKLFRRTVPIGIAFGTVGVLDETGRMHEVTTFRRDVKTDGRHAEVEFGVSLNDDLARRDLTINAMAWEPEERRFEDPFNGLKDLSLGLVRSVGDPQARMREDRLRALRALRFAARFNFQIEKATWKAICDSAPHMGRLSAERVKQEIDKTMEQVEKPSLAFGLWRSSGAFKTLIPPLNESPERYLRAADCLPMPTLKSRPLRRTIRTSSLLAGLPLREARKTVQNLKFSNLESATVLSLIGNWNEIGGDISELLIERGSHGIPDIQLRLWAAGIGRLKVSGFLRLSAAIWETDRIANLPAPEPRDVRNLYRRMITIAFRDPLSIADLAIDGEELARQGIKAGPQMGLILKSLLDWVLQDPLRNSTDLLILKVAQLRAGA